MTDKRVELLDEAKGYVTKDRNSSYGEPEDNFKAIADIWSAQGVSVDGRPVNAVDVSLMMLGMKLARLRHNPDHKDSWVDSAGYAACGYHTASKMREPVKPVVRQSDLAEVGLDPVDVAQHNIREQMHEWMNRRGWKPGDKANNDEVRMRIEQERIERDSRRARSGWLSDNRCQPENPFPHEAHPYDRTSMGSVLNIPEGSQWCDDYVDPGYKAQQHADVEAVKRVADKLKSPTHPDNTRPILDQDY